jgi:dynein heavy chain
MAVTLANEERCEEFRQQFLRFDFLWSTDLNANLKAFLEAEGRPLPDGGRDDPPLAKFEEQIQKYK